MHPYINKIYIKFHYSKRKEQNTNKVNNVNMMIKI